MPDPDRPPVGGPPEPEGVLPSASEPDPAPERERPTTSETPDERGASGEPVGNDNIREGRVDGLMTGPHPSQGQGQGG